MLVVCFPCMLSLCSCSHWTHFLHLFCCQRVEVQSVWTQVIIGSLSDAGECIMSKTPKFWAIEIEPGFDLFMMSYKFDLIGPQFEMLAAHAEVDCSLHVSIAANLIRCWLHVVHQVQVAQSGFWWSAQNVLELGSVGSRSCLALGSCLL